VVVILCAFCSVIKHRELLPIAIWSNMTRIRQVAPLLHIINFNSLCFRVENETTLISAKNRVDLGSISEVRSYITEWPRFFGPPCSSMLLVIEGWLHCGVFVRLYCKICRGRGLGMVQGKYDQIMVAIWFLLWITIRWCSKLQIHFDATLVRVDSGSGPNMHILMVIWFGMQIWGSLF